MKRIIFSLVITLLALSTAVAAPKGNIKKVIKKEVVALNAEGWVPFPNTPSLKEQVTTYIEHLSMVGDDGEPIYIIVTASSIGMSPNIANSMTMQTCKSLAAQEILKSLGLTNIEKNIKITRGKKLQHLQRERTNKIEVMLSIAYNRNEILKANSPLLKKSRYLCNIFSKPISIYTEEKLKRTGTTKKIKKVCNIFFDARSI